MGTCRTACIARRRHPRARTRWWCTSTAVAGCWVTWTRTTRCAAAVQDAFAALQWVDANAIELGGIPGQLAVAGWSAGGNIAAVACQKARDVGGPGISGQVLLTPVTGCDMG